MPNHRFKDLTGQTINGWLVLGLAGWQRRRSLWLARSASGEERIIRTDRFSPRLNQPDDRTKRTWRGMIHRCNQPNDTSFKYYGGRGIKVCARWLESFDAFLADMGQKPGPEYSIDRINNDGDYEPGNCRWATASMQAFNRRRAA